MWNSTLKGLILVDWMNCYYRIYVKSHLYIKSTMCKNDNDIETIIRTEKLFYKLTLMWAYRRFFDIDFLKCHFNSWKFINIHALLVSKLSIKGLFLLLWFTNLTICWQNIFFSESIFVLGNRIDNLTIRKVTWFCIETLADSYSYFKQNHEDPLNRIIKKLQAALRTEVTFSYC